jgi:type I restriction enzyme M protein
MIKDYISGIEINETPEEIEAVQPYLKILVEDYNYPKDLIKSRPQHRVKARPSDNVNEYPVDIAVFSNNKKRDEDLQIIVECKRKNKKDGLNQLKDYLKFSSAFIGVWFNGEEKLYLRKYESNKGQIDFEEIPNIPVYGQRLEDVGKFKRKDLKETHNLKSVFKAIRFHLAANNVGTKRDEALAQQLINIIFCKIFDEKFTPPNEIVSFRAGVNEDPKLIRKRIDKLFKDVKLKYKDVLDDSDDISLIDDSSLVYVIGELQLYCLIDAKRDVVADAFETFIGGALKGGQGQFFTPRNVIKMMIDILDIKEDETVLDPTCGTGGFLVEALRNVWEKIDKKRTKLNWDKSAIQEEKIKFGYNNVYGIDADYFLAKVTKAYMAILGDGKGNIYCEDSLENPNNWSNKTKQNINLGKFDVILSNPPFGSKIPVKGADKLSQFEFGYRWKLDKKNNNWLKLKIRDKESPQIIFIERCLEFLTEEGKLGIVLPDGIFGNDKLGYIRDYLLKKATIIAIIDVPIETFMPNTPTKTSILILKKKKLGQKEKTYPIFMAVAETCGHDRRGNFVDDDDISKISLKFREWQLKNNIKL